MVVIFVRMLLAFSACGVRVRKDVKQCVKCVFKPLHILVASIETLALVLIASGFKAFLAHWMFYSMQNNINIIKTFFCF